MRGLAKSTAKLLVASGILAVGLMLAPHCRAASLAVTVVGIKPGPGTIRVALYDKSDTFRHEDRALRVVTAPAQGDSISVTFDEIKPGRYAVVAYHDANGNGKLDLFLGMFPTEGWGLSNNPRISGPPSFDPSAIEVSDQPANALIFLHY